MQAAELGALARESYISLETFRRNGAGVPTPVWFASSDGRLWVFSEAKAGKIKRLRNSDRARIAACSVSGRVRGPWWEVRARVVSEPERVRTAYAALHAKYGWKMKLADFFSRLAGRIDGRAIIEIDPQVQGA